MRSHGLIYSFSRTDFRGVFDVTLPRRIAASYRGPLRIGYDGIERAGEGL